MVGTSELFTFDRNMMQQQVENIDEANNLVCLGLEPKHIRVIESIIRSTQHLNDEFVVISAEKASHADIILYNGDDPDAFAECRKIRSKEHYVSKTTKTSHDRKRYQALYLPIKRRALVELLTSMMSTKNKVIPSLYKTTAYKLNRILVVDDSYPVRKYMQNKLPLLAASLISNPTLEMDFAVSGKDAVDKIKAARGKYDIIFLDVMMDDINGYKICKWIKSVNKKIYVVMLTSKDSMFDKVRGTMSGCDRYLTKPPKDEDLQNLLASL